MWKTRTRLLSHVKGAELKQKVMFFTELDSFFSYLWYFTYMFLVNSHRVATGYLLPA